MHSQVMLGPSEVAYLFIDAEKNPGIVPLEEQMSISEGDRIAAQIDGTTMVGKVLWQGHNNLCWACELTGDGHSWSVRVVRCCEMIALTALEYSMTLGVSKLTHKVVSPDIENRLQSTSVRVAKMNNLGSEKNRCPDCEIPLTALVERRVVTQLIVVDKTRMDRVRLGEAQDMMDKVESCHLYCPSCETRTDVDWDSVEIEDD